MANKNAHTFNSWLVEEPGEVKVLNKKLFEKSYEFDYVRFFNFVSSKGWRFKDSKWESADGSYRLRTIADAFRKQKFLEEVLDRDK